MSTSETKYYHHGRLGLAGGILPDAITAYRTYGDPKNPCIVFPTCYGGRLDSESRHITHFLHRRDDMSYRDAGLLGQDYMIGPDKALDPSKYYIVTFALFSNGESSSPSNTPIPYNGPYFPRVTYEDNIRAQYAVLTDELKVSKVFCVVGFSMGAQQAYYWPVMYPEYVERFIPICGSARTSPHNACFLEGPKAAVLASKDFNGGHYTSPPQHALRAFGRVYSAWAYGQTWFRNKGYLYNGKYSDLNNWLHADWEGGFLGYWDANDLLTLLDTWQMGDISRIDANSTLATVSNASAGGDLIGVLGSIKAKALIMPCKTDLYFPPEDSENEVQAMKNTDAKLVVIPSVWGHMAGGGSNETDDKFILTEIQKFLA